MILNNEITWVTFFVLTHYKKSTNVLKALSEVCQGSINTKEKGATSRQQTSQKSQKTQSTGKPNESNYISQEPTCDQHCAGTWGRNARLCRSG
jgi:hypothetical protein